jgi:hypothetical protein
LANMVAELNNLLRPKTTVIGIKMFAEADEMAPGNSRASEPFRKPPGNPT